MLDTKKLKEGIADLAERNAIMERLMREMAKKLNAIY